MSNCENCKVLKRVLEERTLVHETTTDVVLRNCMHYKQKVAELEDHVAHQEKVIQGLLRELDLAK